jgi:hypothetical protein
MVDKCKIPVIPSVTIVGALQNLIMIVLILVVLVERLDKDLDLKLLANPHKRVDVSTMQQSKMLRKRRSNGRKVYAKNRRRKKKMLISGRGRKYSE